MVQNPPYVAQGRTDHPAVLFRMTLAGMLSSPMPAGTTGGNGGGVHPSIGNSLVVTGQGSMNVSIDTGLIYIPSTTAWNGNYACYNSASVSVAVPAASSTQWRRDYIAAVVTDPGDNTANWSIVNVEGAFSSSAPGSLPSLPNNAIALGVVNVVPNMTVTNGAGTISDFRRWLPLSGPWLTTSSVKPSLSAPAGTLWYETDTNKLGVIQNGAYQYFSTNPVIDDTWHTITPDGGWSGVASGYAAPSYRKTDTGDLQLTGCMDFGSATTSDHNLNSSNPLPAGYRPVTGKVFRAADLASGRGSVQISTGGIIEMLSNSSTNSRYCEIDAIITLSL
jgi:hypothetical protein